MIAQLAPQITQDPGRRFNHAMRALGGALWLVIVVAVLLIGLYQRAVEVRQSLDSRIEAAGLTDLLQLASASDPDFDRKISELPPGYVGFELAVIALSKESAALQTSDNVAFTFDFSPKTAAAILKVNRQRDPNCKLYLVPPQERSTAGWLVTNQETESKKAGDLSNAAREGLAANKELETIEKSDLLKTGK